MRILVVDDDEVFREEFATFLSDAGHDVRAAPSVRKALEALEETPADVVFSDLKMPRQSGLELLAEVRRRWPQTLLVMVTGFATVETAVEAMKRGAFDYIAKPFRGEQVQEVLARIDEERRFVDLALPSVSPAELARTLADRFHVPVLLASANPGPAEGSVRPLPFDGSQPSELLHAVEDALRQQPRVGLVVADVAEMLRGHSIEDLVTVLRQLRERLDGVGPFAVGLGARGVPREAAEAIRSAVTAPAVQSALEVLASPIRRKALTRLLEGRASFTEAMRAAELDDSPKMSFHLHRLVEEGLVARDRDEYQITPKGTAAVGVLREVEDLAAHAGPRSFVYRPGAAAKRSPAGRRPPARAR